MKPIKTRKVIFRKDTFLQKISRANSSLMIHPREEIKDISVFNNSVVLEVAADEKK